MTLNFQGAEIYYSVVGEGKPTLLLHGFLESSKIWEEFLPEFSPYGKIIIMDLPGHGRSGVVANIHSMELMADAVHAVLQVLDIPKADFIGHSMGGYVGLALMEKHPEMLENFMLLNSTPQADSEEKKEIRERSVEVVQRNQQAYISMAISNLLTPENNERFSDEIEVLKQEAYSFPTEGITAALKGMKIRKDRTAVLKAFRGNKILVAGKDDPLIVLPEIKQLAKETDSSFISFSGGHLTYLENRLEFLKLCISSKK